MTTDIQLEPGKYCYYVPEQDPTEYGGYVPSLVIEDEPGHHPMLGRGRFAAPWVGGKTIEEAQAIADYENAEKLELSPERVTQIVGSSFAAAAVGRDSTRPAPILAKGSYLIESDGVEEVVSHKRAAEANIEAILASEYANREIAITDSEGQAFGASIHVQLVPLD